MKQKITFLLCFLIPLFCIAQNALTVDYNYDAAGNRTGRIKVIEMTDPDQSPPPLSPPAPPVTDPEDPEDETTHFHSPTNFAGTHPLSTEESISQTTLESLPSPDEPAKYFVEKLAKVTMKIYPNPTTEKVTLEISNMERLQTGEFKLFSLTGQLLQTHPVHSETTIISLATLPKGAYILKVHINERTEDWKIIKN